MNQSSQDNTIQSQRDHRQRFFIDNSPVRGDVVRLHSSYQEIIAQKQYPLALQHLLGEMLVSVSLLISTLKIEGRLSIQLQSTDDNSLLKWAMAESDHDGNVRGLASWSHETEAERQAWTNKATANDAFAELGAVGKGVMFINIQPLNQHSSKSYQGIVERTHDNLADCLAHYQQQSAQIATVIKLACDGEQAGGLLVQLLPLSQAEEQLAEQEEYVGDSDLWTRVRTLTNTIKADELTALDSNEILFRLYNEEEVMTPEHTELQFACTCSQAKSESAIIQLGEADALQIANECDGVIQIDCGFCGNVYQFDIAHIQNLFSQQQTIDDHETI